MMDMWPFESKELKQDVRHLKAVLHNSFVRVRHDTNSIFQWISYLEQHNTYLQNKAKETEAALQEVLKKLDALPSSPAHIRQLIDQYYAENPLAERIDAVSGKIDTLHNLHKEKLGEVFHKLEHLSQRLDKVESQKTSQRTNFKERIIKKIQKSSKDYVKNLILSFVHKYEKISALKLREIVVEEQGLCSKSSFYRILEELEKTQDDVSVVQQGKEKLYLSKIVRRI